MTSFYSTTQALNGQINRLSEPVLYAVSVTREEFANGQLTETTVSKQVALHFTVHETHSEVVLHTQSITLNGGRHPPPLEQLAVRLAVLYRELVLAVSPVGQLVALANHSDLMQTWAALKQDLRASSHETDKVMEVMIDQVEQQLQDPTRVLHSLRHDYLYQALLHALPHRVALIRSATPRPVEFAQFFEGQALWFSEQGKPGRAKSATLAVREFEGTLDEQRTDMGAIRQLVQAALRAPRDTFSASTAEELRCGYEATHTVAVATGLPQTVALTVYCRLADRYNKQYNLTIERL